MKDPRQPLKNLLTTTETKTIGEIVSRITSKHYSVRVGNSTVIADSIISGDLSAGSRVLLAKSAGGKMYIHALAGIPKRNIKEVNING